MAMVRARRQRERRVPARRDRHHRIAGQKLAPLQLSARRVGAILHALGCAPDGLEPAGLDCLHAIGRVAERGRDLRCIEHAHAPAGARAHVEPAPATLEHEHEHLDGAFDVSQHEAHRSGGDQILGVDDLQDLAGAAPIEIARRLEDRLGE